MKNLVAIIGSPRGYNSNTYKIAFKILQELRNRNIEILPKFFILSELEINKCIGCAKCFFNASSCVSFRDSMDEVEKALLESDLIIFGSPVYAHNVTGEMKIFIDRLSYMLHLLKLTGKYGITISTSSSNGNVSVDDYLNKIMLHLGINVIEQISYKDLYKYEYKDFSVCINNIANSITSDILTKSNELQEKIFSINKNAYLKIYQNELKNKTVLKNKEALYWHDNRYFNFNSFKELFNEMKRKEI